MTEIRTRFAPSPTGFMHVGNLRTGLFAYLTARHSGGKFVLRLEDTDKNREVEGSAQHILDCLQMLGLEYDEGIEKGGPYAPYKQSARLSIYQSWAQRLIETGRAYADPYTAAEVQAFREQAQKEKKAFLYRHHRPEHPPTWDGTSPLRFKSEPKSYQWHDEVMGDLSTGPDVIDDFILIKSDGYPTYNFAHIVDDAEMSITLVIRGQEFLSSMPNYLNLYEALAFQPTDAEPLGNELYKTSATRVSPGAGASGTRHEAVLGNSVGEKANTTNQIPKFATMPHIMNEQGNKKLGKRDGAKDVLDYVREGYLPETLLSFIATLGWNDGTEQEVFTKNELIEKFSLERVQKSGARFDEKRLLWMNGQFIRSLSVDELQAKVASLWPESANKYDESYQRKIVELVQERLKTLHDLPTLTTYFFEEPTIDMSLIDENKQLKKLNPDDIKAMLSNAKTALEATEWTPEAIQQTLNDLLTTTGQKPGILFSIIRIVTTWSPFSPQLNETLALIGKDRTLERLSNYP